MKKKKTRPAEEGKVPVNSEAYGLHYRSPRGTHKEAKLNVAYLAGNADLKRSNIEAPLFKKEIETYFALSKSKSPLLWQRLLSVIRKGYKTAGSLNVQDFVGFNVFEKYRLDRLLHLSPSINFAPEKLSVNVRWTTAPDFKRKYPDGYVVGVYCTIADLEKQTSCSLEQWSEAFPLFENNKNCSFQLEYNFSDKDILIWLSVKPTKEGRIHHGMATSGIECIWAREKPQINP